MTQDNVNEELDEAISALPNGVKLAWGITKQPSRGPKGELSIAKIVEAAIEIADRDGLASLSMSRVAAALGFTAMSLYRYVSGKEDLLVLMQDAVCAKLSPPGIRRSADAEQSDDCGLGAAAAAAFAAERL